MIRNLFFKTFQDNLKDSALELHNPPLRRPFNNSMGGKDYRFDGNRGNGGGGGGGGGGRNNNTDERGHGGKNQ